MSGLESCCSRFVLSFTVSQLPQKNHMPQTTPAGAACGYFEAGILQAFVKTLIVLFPPHSQNSIRCKCGPHGLNDLAAIKRVIARVAFGVGAAVQVQYYGIEQIFAIA